MQLDLGVLDAEAGAVEITADAGEEVGPVGAVDQHLQAVADRRGACAHDRRGGLDVAPQRTCMPGDLIGVVAGEIAQFQRVPQRLLHADG